jgi:hypothetical protein
MPYELIILSLNCDRFKSQQFAASYILVNGYRPVLSVSTQNCIACSVVRVRQFVSTMASYSSLKLVFIYIRGRNVWN